MIVKKLDDIVGTTREVSGETWVSRRLLLRQEGMGFSMHDTLIRPNTSTEMQYLNHLEAVYCIAGRGRLEAKATGKVFDIEPGVLYALDQHDAHILHADTELRMVCVFNPPLTGREVHDARGAYPAATDS